MPFYLNVSIFLFRKNVNVHDTVCHANPTNFLCSITCGKSSPTRENLPLTFIEQWEFTTMTMTEEMRKITVTVTTSTTMVDNNNYDMGATNDIYTATATTATSTTKITTVTTTSWRRWRHSYLFCLQDEDEEFPFLFIFTFNCKKLTNI
jgi:hypothetical protein